MTLSILFYKHRFVHHRSLIHGEFPDGCTALAKGMNGWMNKLKYY